jgi:hypothetical protein
MSHQVSPIAPVHRDTYANFSTQNVSTTAVKLAIDTPSPIDGWTEASDVFTCTKAGWYSIVVRMYFASGVNWRNYIIVNGVSTTLSGWFGAYTGSFSCILYFYVGDTLEVQALNSTGSIALDTTYPYINLVKIMRIGG